MKFGEYFSEETLNKIYNEKIIYTQVSGIDKMSNYKFKEYSKNRIKKMSKELNDGKYKFKPYKIILIPKKVNSYPRKVCVPTIRDRIVIEAVKEYIYDVYKDYNLNIGISNLVDGFVNNYNESKYKKYIKTDLSSFFDTINHDLLLKKLNRKITDQKVINLIKIILTNEQQYINEKSKKNLVGVPQGLSISMLLANIFMLEIDDFFCHKEDIKYYRYVDDIFIFLNNRVIIYYFLLKFKLFLNKLKINKVKTKISKIYRPFVFLGYQIEDNSITVKKQSKEKLENSIENIFKNYKKNLNIDELVWRLNIRISGAICNNKKYGWLFYFRNINDLKLLYHLDDLVNKFKKRYNVEYIQNKSFIKTYYEIKRKNIKNNNYFFNIDNCSDEEKKQILKNITDIKEEEIESLNLRDLDYNYRKAVFKCIKSLERDLDNIS